MSGTHCAAPSNERCATRIASIDAILVCGRLDFFNGGSNEEGGEQAKGKKSGDLHGVYVHACKGKIVNEDIFLLSAKRSGMCTVNIDVDMKTDLLVSDVV